MSEPKTIGQIMCEMAATPAEPMGKLLRKCPLIQAELLRQGEISLDDLSDEELDKLDIEDEVLTAIQDQFD